MAPCVGQVDFTVFREMNLYVAVVFMHAMVMCVTCQSAPRCYNESQYGPSPTSQDALIRHDWDAGGRDGTFTATPFCLNETYDVIRRKCFNGIWFPKGISNCYDFACPKPFIYEDRGTCSYTATLRTISDVCPSITSVVTGEDTCTADHCVYKRKCVYKTEDFLEHPSSSSTSADINATLTFHLGERKLLLTVYSTEAVDEDLTRCYTNYVDVDLLQNRKLVNVSKIYDSRWSEAYGRYSFRNFSVYEVGVEGESRQYWCQVHQKGKFRPLATDRIVAYERKTGNVHSIRANVFDYDFEANVRYFCKRCRMMEVQRHNQSRMIVVLHLTTNDVQELAVWASELRNKSRQPAFLLDIKDSEFCQQEATGEDETLLHWPATPLGSWASPTEFCGYMLTRKCQGDFLYGAKWGEPQGHCSPQTSKTTRSKSKTNILDEVRGLMSTNTSKLTTTEVLLKSLDDYVLKNFDELGKIKESNLLVHHEDNATGLGLYGDGFRRVRTSLDHLNTDGLELAVFLPKNLTELLVTVFRNDRLFPGGEVHAGSDIVKVNALKVGAYLETPIIAVFKNKGVFKRTACALWDYDTNRNSQWSTLGANHIATIKENFTACAFSHLRRHLAVVVLSGEEVVWKDFQRPSGSTTDANFGLLSLIFYVLSGVGVGLIVAVIVTVVMAKCCRRKDRRK